MKQKFALMGALVLLLAAQGFTQGGQQAAPRFEPAQIVSATEVVYPPNAVQWGTVVMEVTVGLEGEVEEVRVVRGSAPFAEEARKAIEQWKFKPARLDGEPIRSAVPVAFTFSQPRVWWFGQQRNRAETE